MPWKNEKRGIGPLAPHRRGRFKRHDPEAMHGASHSLLAIARLGGRIGVSATGFVIDRPLMDPALRRADVRFRLRQGPHAIYHGLFLFGRYRCAGLVLLQGLFVGLVLLGFHMVCVMQWNGPPAWDGAQHPSQGAMGLVLVSGQCFVSDPAHQ